MPQDPATAQLNEVSPFTFEAFEWTPECESIHHEADDAQQVDHGGAARYFVIGPCKHTTGFRCEPSVLSAMATSQGLCDQCRSFWPRTHFIYHRIGD
jgi:hypothetical protein